MQCRFVLIAGLALLLASCIDGTGPRPRPGAVTDEPPTTTPATLVWYETQPRVITQGRSDSVTLNVAVTGSVTGVEFQPRTGAQLILRPVNAGLYTIKLHPALVLFGYPTGDLHHIAGIINVSGPALTDQEYLAVNVKDGTVPSVAFSTLQGGGQASAHVVNLRVDNLNVGGEVAPALVRMLYDNYGDDYNFIAVIEAVQSAHIPSYLGVRNDVRGLGIAQFDRGANYGSAAKLEGIVHYPNAADFDLAQTTNLRTLGNRWMNFLTHPSLSPATPLWPLSSLALGVMGWSDPQTHQPLTFPYDILRQPDGTHLLRTTDTPRNFNDMELYLMGLLPADSVRTHFVFADQNQKSQVRQNGVLRGAVDSVRVTAVVARDGPRVPAFATAPRNFRIATLVLTRNGLLSADEIAFFDYMAARGEQRVSLPFADGLTRGSTLPFYVATGGRASLTTTLRGAAPN